ncbi:Hpt domain-containing protein [Mangrovimonas sp. TPBH4]|uniref:Hpt domain-containing protein n=1 Tax=Mangrovimonas sp. TPBH4 TaxID=1645914 RepID=UPI0006B4EBEB|nr:Hpt domain-containing protein [Mangrovimonas sp. TPBH4]
MIDLTFLKKFTKGDVNKMKGYIQLYIDMAPDTFRLMKESLVSGNWNQLRINAHSLKPQAEFMGLNDLKDLLILIENKIKTNNLEDIEIVFKNAYNIHLESANELQKILMKL